MAGQDAAKKAGLWAKGRWADFRQESPYFQGKVGLAAIYVVIVVLTIFLAPPRGDKWACTEERIPFGLAFKTALIISNLRNGDLDDGTGARQPRWVNDCAVGHQLADLGQRQADRAEQMTDR